MGDQSSVSSTSLEAVWCYSCEICAAAEYSKDVSTAIAVRSLKEIAELGDQLWGSCWKEAQEHRWQHLQKHLDEWQAAPLDFKSEVQGMVADFTNKKADA
jgi:hypothetical protein